MRFRRLTIAKKSKKKAIKISGRLGLQFPLFLILSIAMLELFVANAAADNNDFRSAGQENWVRFTFILKDAQTGQPINGRIYYQSKIAADSFYPDNTQPLLPPGVYRLVGWERNYWQTEENFIVDPRKGLRQQRTITLEKVAPKHNYGLQVPKFLSNLVIEGNATEKMPHMNDSWFIKNNICSFYIWTKAWSEFPGGSGGGSRTSTAHIEYDFFNDTAGAKKRFDFTRQFFTQSPSKLQRISGPSTVSLGDEALQISIDTLRSDGSGRILYETRRFMIRYQNVLIRMEIHREVDLPFLTSPENILGRIRAVDMQKVKRVLEPEPYPWPKITPPLQAHPNADSSLKDNNPVSSEQDNGWINVQSVESDGSAFPENEPPVNENAPISPEDVLLAVAGGSMVMALGAFLQLFGMGGLHNITNVRSLLDSLLQSSGTDADLAGAEATIREAQAAQEVKPLPPEVALTQHVIPDPIPSGFEFQDKVWCQPPWDKSGAYWMSKSDHDAMRSMMREGKVWSDRWGWVAPEEGKAMESQRSAAWDACQSDTDDDIKALTDNIKESQRKLSEIHDKQAELEKIEQLRERLAELERQRKLDNSFATYLRETAKNYSAGVNKDLDELPGDLKRLARSAASEIKISTGALFTAAGDTTNEIYSGLTDVDNYKAVGRAAVDTAKELLLHPVDSSVKMGGTVKGAASVATKVVGTAANVAIAIASHPIDFAEAVVGIDNWRKVLDPNVPVGERVSRAVYGAVDAVLSFGSCGTNAAVKGMETGLDGVHLVKTIDAGTDAAKAVKGADAATDLAKITAKLDDPARVKAWEAGRLAGQQKADKLAEALKRGDTREIKKALVECQKDKHSIQALNKGDDSVKLAYNENMKKLITDDVDKVMKEKIAQRYGIDPKDVEIIKPTNPSAKPKIGSDLDFTVKVKAKPGEFVPDPKNPGKFVKVEPGDVLTKDVPVKDAQQIYNRELYSKVHGEPIPTDPKKIEAFQAKADKLAHDMDHVAGHRVGTESYGASQQDLDVILQKSGGQFTDPEQAGQLASFKSTHLYQEAENLAKVDPHKAEALISDGMRQTTKQYSNLIETRVAALQSQGVQAAVDPRLTKAVDILKQVENNGLAPSRAEALLKAKLNISKDDVANMLGAQLAKLHMMKP